MSITPAQIILQVATAENATASTPSPQPSIPLVRASASAPESPSPVPSPAISSPAPLATDLRIDSQHQFYYEFVDDSTGDVVFEIPPEALRAIGESLNVTLDGGESIHSVDVKS